MTYYQFSHGRDRADLFLAFWTVVLAVPLSHLLRFYRVRRTVRQLRALSDQQLHDIGVRRSDIDKVARAAVDPAP